MHYAKSLGAIALAVFLALAGPVGARAQEIQYNQADMIRGLLPTVVNITAHAQWQPDAPSMTASAPEPSPSYQVKSSAGSGFIVDPSGVILTNWHVVDGAYEIFVTFSDGQRVRAELMNAARIIDIALLKVEVGRKLPAVRWGDSAKVQIGEPVLAIGNPLGVGLSVTGGIVSALNRNINDTPYDDFIQTDASINHGNSGGPLFNIKGEVIGVNSALISPTAASAGLGFAIPSRDAHLIVDRLMSFGWVRPGWLGVKIQQVTPEMAEGLGMAVPVGAIVAWVSEGGPADKAGVRLGDVIIRFADEEPTDERALLRAIASSAPGREATLTVIRDGARIDLPVTLAEWPKMQWEQRDAPVKVVAPHWNVPPDLGIMVTPLTPELRAHHEIPPGRRGVLVTGVVQDADAARQHVSPGDVILQIGNATVETQTDLQRGIDLARNEKRDYAMLLVYPKSQPDPASKFIAPKWVPLRVSSE